MKYMLSLWGESYKWQQVSILTNKGNVDSFVDISHMSSCCNNGCMFILVRLDVRSQMNLENLLLLLAQQSRLKDGDPQVRVVFSYIHVWSDFYWTAVDGDVGS